MMSRKQDDLAGFCNGPDALAAATSEIEGRSWSMTGIVS